MKKSKRIVSLILSLVMVMSVLTFITPRTQAEAAEGELATPSVKIKRINGGTGVKFTIEKTKGAEWYRIEYVDIDNEYSDYMYLPYSLQYGKVIYRLEQDGTAKRTYTIKGLPKGTYTFRVVACKADGSEKASKNKTVKIKAGKKVSQSTQKDYDFSDVKVGDTITFGTYEQDADMNNGTEDIEWTVLSKDSEKMLVISKYVIDFLGYNNNFSEVTWEDCTLRKWLNEVFINKAFSKAEKKMIKTTKVKASDNPQYGTKGGKTTKDKVFILSLEQATNPKLGFSKDNEEYDLNRRTAPTEYVLSKDGNSLEWALVKTQNHEEMVTAEDKYAISWFVRTPGDVGNYITFALPQGRIFLIGNATYEEKGVRPAMYISLK